MEKEYHEKVGLKWVFLVCGLIIFGFFGYWLMTKIAMLFYPNYDRSGIQKVCNDYFGDATLDNVLTEEIALVSFEYNLQRPMIYSKYYASIDPFVQRMNVSYAA